MNMMMIHTTIVPRISRIPHIELHSQSPLVDVSRPKLTSPKLVWELLIWLDVVIPDSCSFNFSSSALTLALQASNYVQQLPPIVISGEPIEESEVIEDVLTLLTLDRMVLIVSDFCFIREDLLGFSKFCFSVKSALSSSVRTFRSVVISILLPSELGFETFLSLLFCFAIFGSCSAASGRKKRRCLVML